MVGEGPELPAPLSASVVICSRGRPEMLAATVASLLDAGQVPCEIIVVDQSERPNGSVSRMGVVRGCDVRYVRSSEQGVSRGRNLGVGLASSPTIVIFDDDMLALETSLAHLLAPLGDDASKTVLTGRILAAPPEGPGLRQASGGLVTDLNASVYRGRQPQQVVPGPNVALPRGLLMEIGGYDERLGPGTRFPAAEDHDLSLRLLDAGCEVRHVPESVVLHRAWRSRKDLVRLRWMYARGVGAFYAKHVSFSDRHVLNRALHEFAMRLKKAVTSAYSSPATTAAQLISMAGLCAGAAEWVLTYRLDPRCHRNR